MSDPDLFAAGMGITFLFFAGVYVAARERFLEHESYEDEDE
jgi:hypothetical protein